MAIGRPEKELNGEWEADGEGRAGREDMRQRHDGGDVGKGAERRAEGEDIL